MVKELVNVEANIEHRDEYGKTPMNYASKMVKEVLEDVKIANKKRAFIQKLRVERRVEGVTAVKEELIEVDKEPEKKG
jgi:hypothetical protein